ncbi:hypothetical protein OG792_32420 [Micromonospora sp. NBC_01699]|uniref:RICIN domain-containing protein n=1 Tax=Micromonospora sp. NBC_01699 TaxID=2975984 RepID=UPI002E2B4BD1|nr:hypothetical protein [Micromonospora sp. NBC_01699]
MRDDHLDDGLRSIAAHAARTGRLTTVAADIRKRGDARRKRRHVATATLGVALVGVLTTGVALARPDNRPYTGPPAAPPASAGPSVSVPVSPSLSPPPPIPGRATDPVLSGTREVTIVRVQASESAVSLDGDLVEVDDDSGRQLFVPTPLDGDTYLIKAYGKPDNHPASDEASCWQVLNPGTSESLTVEAAACDADNPGQRFTITASGKDAYAISNSSAFLQFSATRGLILEELGDAPPRSTFRFVDNGPARRPAGG